MEERVLLICEEGGCSDEAVEKVAEICRREPVKEVYVLKVLKHPPLQWCEHGGADSEEQEKALDEEVKRKRDEWIARQRESHEEEVEGVAGKLENLGVKGVRTKFIEEEIDLATTIVSEIEEAGYGTVVLSERVWDRISTRKAVKKIPRETKIITVASLTIGPEI